MYYNPGRLALVERPELLLSGTVFELATIDLTPRESSRALSASRFALSPSLFAGELRFGFLGDRRLAYSFLARQQSGFDLQGFWADTGSSSLGLSSEGAVTDSVRLDHRLSEYWGGLTWARPVGDRFGVGISTFVVSRNHRGFAQRIFTDAGDQENAALVLQTNDYNYGHWRIVWKLGVGTRLEGWDLGAALTLPGLSLGGNGQVAVDDLRVVVSAAPPTVVSVGQQGLKARFESPLSVAAGGSRSFGECRVHLTLEWFFPQGLYTVVDALPLVAATGDVILDPSLRQQASGVINAAAGFEHRFGSEVTGYASIRSDRSSVVDGSVSNVAFTRWNLVHAAAGATFSTGDTDFTLGVIGAFGTSRATPRSVAGNFDSS